MATFTYEGEDKEGNPVKETVTAGDRFAVYALARQNGHTVRTISEAGRFSLPAGLSVDRINAFLSRVKDDEIIMVTRNLGSMITAGLTVSRALSVIERQSKNPRLKMIITALIARINKGEQFYEGLQEFPKEFSNLYVAMVKAGEESGNLAESLKTLAMQLERANNLKKKIKGAMIYPSIVLLVMVVIAVLMMIFVMPQIIKVFESGKMELPPTTKFLIWLTNFMQAYTVFVIGALIGAVIGVLYFFKTKIGKLIMSFTVVRLPVIGTMAKETNAARTARTLSSLLKSGVDVIQSLEITEEVVQNVFYKRIVRRARDRVEKGAPLSETFIEENKLYPILVGEMILVGEETGQISGMLGELATFYETEVERKTKDLSTIIEPLLMVVIGTGVGFFALALIAPIYSISDGIS
jgi:type II secretory pathway component PulF